MNIFELFFINHMFVYLLESPRLVNKLVNIEHINTDRVRAGGGEGQ